MDVPESVAKATYSAVDRALIRDQLLAYCEQHQIGTPTLQTRIATASDRQSHELSNKTLQRFLAGATRTNDAFVWLCHKFLDDTESERPVVTFGRALCAYYQHETDADAITSVAGTYEKTEAGAAGNSRLVLTAEAGLGFMTASEGAHPEQSAAGNGHAIVYEGVAFLQAQGLTIVMRDVLTRRCRWHALSARQQSEVGELVGSETIPLMFDPDGEGYEVRSIAFAKVSAE